MSDTTTLREPQVTEAEVRAAVKGTKLADAKTVAEITKMVNRWAVDGKRPLHTYCREHGTKAAMTAIAYFEKRLAEYGTVFKLLTTYVGRGGKSSAAKKAPPVVATAPVATKAAATPTKSAKTDAPRATSNKRKVNASSEIIEEDEKGATTRRRHTIEDSTGAILVQYDEFPLDRDKENLYIIGSSALRMELMA